MISKPCQTFLAPHLHFSSQLDVSGCFLYVQGRILLLKRHPQAPQGTTWGIPSGKLEKNETPFEAIIREVGEEIGIKLDQNEVKGIGTLFVQHTDLDFCYHMFYVERKQIPVINLNLEENTDASWVTLDEALELPLIGGGADTLRYFFDRVTTKFP